MRSHPYFVLQVGYVKNVLSVINYNILKYVKVHTKEKSMTNKTSMLSNILYYIS